MNKLGVGGLAARVVNENIWWRMIRRIARDDQGKQRSWWQRCRGRRRQAGVEGILRPVHAGANKYGGGVKLRVTVVSGRWDAGFTSL